MPFENQEPYSAQELMRFSVGPDEDNPARMVVRLIGELDLSNREELVSGVNLEGLIETHQFETLVYDLTDTEYMDANGIKMLFESQKLLEAAGKNMLIRNPSGLVARVIEIINLSDRITIEYTNPRTGL